MPNDIPTRKLHDAPETAELLGVEGRDASPSRKEGRLDRVDFIRLAGDATSGPDIDRFLSEDLPKVKYPKNEV